MNNNKFKYTYSAPTQEERREIEDIKRQYDGSKPEKDKLTQLRELHARVNTSPLILGLTLGVVGILIFGTGLTMALQWDLLVWGVVVMAAGSIAMGLAYPMQKLLLERNKRKYGGEIVRLSEELLHEEEQIKE